MRNAITLLATLLLAGCATVQSATLMPRGPDRTQGKGSLDRIRNVLTVELKGNRYQGPVTAHTTTTTGGLFGIATSTTHTNQSSALLIGDAGQIRCDFGWDTMMIRATGVCVDHQNVIYDLLIQN